MDKENQINEIAKVIFEYVDSKDRKNVYIVHSGIAEDMKTYSHNYGVAEALYNAGYRKIPKGSVVFTQEEYLRMVVEERALDKASEEKARKQAVKEALGRVKTRLEEYCLENAYFTTTEAIWQMNASVFYIEVTQDGALIDKIAKEFGVE